MWESVEKVFIGERLEGFKNGRLGLAFLNFVMVKRTLSRDGIYCYRYDIVWCL